MAFCNRRGASWWRSIPRIGAGRARAVLSWLRRQDGPLKLRVDADVDSVEQVGVPGSRPSWSKWCRRPM
ncbi:phage integrase family protein [Caballeronia arvi]|uniref:phage integrase family protein n=1 Tax=Caballeronia arvi TaxID=1777135 RepID=UPI001F3E9A0B|nr:phage integrase family protein [Caballeronia arvi]